jgi:hypothetical protein
MGRLMRGRAAGLATGTMVAASKPISGSRAMSGHGLASVGHPRGQGRADNGEDRVGSGGAAGGQTRVEAEATEVRRAVAA